MSHMTVSPKVSSYLSESHTILAASQALADALASTSPSAEKDDEVDYAVERLKGVVSRTTATQPGRLGFLGTETTAPEAATLTTRDALAIAEADANIALVLFAASDAIGERASPAGPEPLRAALRPAEINLKELDAPTVSDLGFSRAPERRFFSNGIKQATQTFHTQAESALDKILDEADKAVSKIFEQLKDRKNDIIEGFSEAGKLFDAGSSVAALLRKAWEKLISALETIRQIAALAPIQEALEDLKEMVESLSLRVQLESIFEAPELRAEIDAFKPQSSLPADQVDERSTDLSVLGERFARMVANIRTVTRVVAVVGPLVTVHFAGPFATLAVPAAYSLAMVAVVVLGRDYTHAGRFNEGQGIFQIVDGLKAPATANAG